MECPGTRRLPYTKRPLWLITVWQPHRVFCWEWGGGWRQNQHLIGKQVCARMLPTPNCVTATNIALQTNKFLTWEHYNFSNDQQFTREMECTMSARWCKIVNMAVAQWFGIFSSAQQYVHTFKISSRVQHLNVTSSLWWICLLYSCSGRVSCFYHPSLSASFHINRT